MSSVRCRSNARVQVFGASTSVGSWNAEKTNFRITNVLEMAAAQMMIEAAKRGNVHVRAGALTGGMLKICNTMTCPFIIFFLYCM